MGSKLMAALSGKKIRRLLALGLAAALLLGGPADFRGKRVLAAGENLIENPDFAQDDMSMWLDTGATITRDSQAEEIYNGVKTFATISGRTETFQGFSQDVTDKVVPGEEYEVSFYVKLSEEYRDKAGLSRTVFFGPHIVVNGENQYLSQAYSGKITGNLLMECPAEEWTQLSGSFEVPEEATRVVIRIQEEGSVKGSYSVTGVSLKKKEAAAPQQSNAYEGVRLRDAITAALGEDTIVGMVTHPVNNKKEWAVLTTHANAVTAGNELKPDSHFGYSNNRVPGTETVTLNGKQLLVPKVDFSRGNQFLNAVLKYNEENPATPIRMRGHVLVWHSQTPEWFFHVDYDASKDYVTKDVMNQRLEWYIKTILEHYVGEDSKYRDVFYGWDVVNEAVSDGGAAVYRDESGNSNWWRVYQSNEFVINAFKFANKYAPADVELYYNDYGDSSPVKAPKICQLLRDVKEQEGAPGVGTRIDAFGMQGHYGLDDFDIDNFEAAARSYLDILGKVQLTELDMAASSRYDGTAATQEQEYLDQAICYMKIFETLKKLEQVEGYDITGITFWGVTDPTSWLQSRSNVGGGQDGTRKQVPLLFDGQYQPKPSFWAFVDPTKIEIARKQLVIRRSYGAKGEKEVWYEFGSGKLTAILKPLWNEEGLLLKLNVTDNSNDGEEDFITVYLDESNGASADAKPTVTKLLRTEADSYNGGYDAQILIPVQNPYFGQKLGLDIVVTGGDGKKAYLNDVMGMQESTTSHYAEAVLKPAYANITKGSAIVDGEPDEIWKTANTFWLNMNDSAQAAAKVKLLWDENKLYLYSEIQAERMDDGIGLEIFLDENHGAAKEYEPDDKMIRISAENAVTIVGEKADAKNVESFVRKMGNGYVMEVAIAWTDLTPKVYSQLGMELKVTGFGGTAPGTLSWFDESGEAMVSPARFGDIVLAAEAKEQEDVGNPDAALSKAMAFTGLTESNTTGQDAEGKESADLEPTDTPSDEGKKGSTAPWIIVMIACAAAVCGGLYFLLRRRAEGVSGEEKKGGPEGRESSNGADKKENSTSAVKKAEKPDQSRHSKKSRK